MNMKLNNRDFTHIEMLLALAILSLIVAIGMSVYDGSYSFFSSIRRHTRSLCDWSSDVCSSDLIIHHGGIIHHSSHEPGKTIHSFYTLVQHRSEERRVGKECRSRWSPYDEKKNRVRRIEAELRLQHQCEDGKPAVEAEREHQFLLHDRVDAWIEQRGLDVGVFFFKQKTAYEITV